MRQHIETGKIGEELAARWLTQKGFTIIYKNWRIGKLELDIVATKADFIHFIEVKTRRSTAFGTPELFVNHKKFITLQRAVQAFLSTHKKYRWVQYDVIAITLAPNQQPRIEIFWDVYC